MASLDLGTSYMEMFICLGNNQLPSGIDKTPPVNFWAWFSGQVSLHTLGMP